ncbi:Glyoxalase-like domain-containing protein [Saccharomonospora viridis]|jgi:catechol 2,3-dioxygenase-like lactoylglutathione lyase family enzyme|uniref:Glyoxalase/Bleomycin resistance protein/Dioxygenase superfamily n=2 Tax=Saccharomonospora viridis TaxID=1852 RepID=C7MPR8_SACVD|nr:Glyoxalase/Bleomycin resistance protein/Dioxygenase superfamily [Saccharomonospora viridis DSM 43017]SFO99579.1 Glyoxalase-like domain-containing protein [Saccharomonospora viridis]
MAMDVLSSRILLNPKDPEVTTAFYRDTLGLAIYREFPGGTVFFLGGGFLEIVGRGEKGRTSDVALWLQVRDLAATVAELRQKGVVLDREPRREPWGLDEAWLSDPDGTRIVLVEVPSDHPLRVDVRTP